MDLALADAFEEQREMHSGLLGVYLCSWLTAGDCIDLVRDYVPESESAGADIGLGSGGLERHLTVADRWSGWFIDIYRRN